ncbi:hypothetical protein U3516DRAFT_749466 [Neocallimastix sp. 'constans']
MSNKSNSISNKRPIHIFTSEVMVQCLYLTVEEGDMLSELDVSNEHIRLQINNFGVALIDPIIGWIPCACIFMAEVHSFITRSTHYYDWNEWFHSNRSFVHHYSTRNTELKVKLLNVLIMALFNFMGYCSSFISTCDHGGLIANIQIMDDVAISL